jgi:alpha-L-fucosidase
MRLVDMLNKIVLLGIVLCASYTLPAQSKLPLPSKNQLAWQQTETNGFVHFGANNPAAFKNAYFDAKQIVRTMKEAGFKIVVFTAKHHAGFCLWPSKYTDNTIASSGERNGSRDLVREMADACKEYGMGLGLYLSPWDGHEPTYGTPAYNDFYKNQLRELLSNYGPLAEVWFDGYKGPNAKPMDYDWQGYFKIVRELQPNAVIFSDIGPDVRWVGNERGNASETSWSTISVGTMLPGKAKPAYLNTGDAGGEKWMASETDVSIRPGWFYNPAQDAQIKSGKDLMNIYYQSVGRNSVLLLNVPPNRYGVISDADRQSLMDFKSIREETFKNNLAKGAAPDQLTDKNLASSVTINEGASKEISFSQPVQFDRVMLQENIADGQRQVAGKLEYWDGQQWQLISQLSTIGYKRLLKVKPVSTQKVRYTVVQAKLPVELAEIGFYKASPKE